MKFFLLIFLFIANIYANSFIEALKNGNKEGDINLLFDYTSSKPNKNNKYQTGGYLATTFGLYYKSAFYEYFRIHIGFRGALPLWEQKKNAIYIGGKGTTARDFWDNNKAMIARSYLEYFDGDTSIKAGRIENSTDMLLNHFDGVWISNKSLGYLLIDAIYMNQYGKVLDRDLSGFEKIKRYDNLGNIIGNSKYGGAYYIGLTFEVFKWLKLKAYGLTSPKIYSFVAAKILIDLDYFNASAGFINGFEHQYSKFNNNSYLAHADIGLNFDSQYGRFYGNIGYINTSKNSGIGSLQISGNSFNPFFYWSGDALNYNRALNLVWGKIGYSASFLDIYLVYGYNNFKILRNDNKRFSQGEVNLYFDWSITPITNIIIHVLNTHKGKEAIPNITQASIMFKINL
ncbi:Opr family porin [Helicobacter sp. MIT 14-3879]|uniref:Opr family porin n=1 Tax=Helicobacter sp. MIT 14-3879 TaxID=2040649 RepID=UPI000E1E54C1|nr:Opr family porin [Helicobacter sp. MIT 14-3879]RDU62885.1 hypothetical protein CQA44_06200 [Helicobacter sp. MIT 14-3879]